MTMYDSKLHPKVREMDANFQQRIYPKLNLTQLNIRYNGGQTFHDHFKSLIKHLQKITETESSKYGVQLWLYQVVKAIRDNNTGFKVSLDPETFRCIKGNHTSYHYWIQTLQGVVDAGYGTLYVGDSNKEGVDTFYNSVFEISSKGFALLENKNINLAPSSKIKHRKKCVITTIKHNKKWEEEVTTAGVREYQNNLNLLNQHCLKFEYKSFNGVVTDPQMDQKFSLYAKPEKNNGLTMFESYGRYINAFQSMRQTDRQFITINDLPVCEADYGSNHARIAYQLEGIDLPVDFKPYHIPDVESPIKGTQEAKRAVYKLAIMMLFNSGNAGKSLFNELEGIFTKLDNFLPCQIKGDKSLVFKDLHRQPTETECHEIVRLLKKRNEPINKYFNGKSAALLQNLDSRIASEVMNHLMLKGLPFICIHDSFISWCTAADDLLEAMFEGWRKVLGSDSCCVVDFKYGKPVPTEDLEEREDYDLWMETTTEQDRRLFVNGAVQHFFDWEQLAEVWQRSGRDLTPLMLTNRDNLPIPF